MDFEMNETQLRKIFVASESFSKRCTDAGQHAIKLRKLRIATNDIGFRLTSFSDLVGQVVYVAGLSFEDLFDLADVESGPNIKSIDKPSWLSLRLAELLQLPRNTLVALLQVSALREEGHLPTQFARSRGSQIPPKVEDWESRLFNTLSPLPQVTKEIVLGIEDQLIRAESTEGGLL